MNDQFLIRGVRLSLLLHGLLLSSIAYVATILPELTPPLVIDFSITKGSSAGQSPNPSPEQAEPVQEALPPIPPVEKRTSEIQPEPAELKIAEPQPKEPEKVPTPQPVTRKIVSVHAKKKLAVVENPPEPVVKSPPEPVTEVVQEELRPKEVTTQSATSPPAASLQRQAASENEAPAAAQTRTASSAKERYIKANFSFIREAIERNTTYPNIARKMGWQGKVLLSFTILADGQVENIRVVESCGYTALDTSAVNTIKRCAPFPKPPLGAEITLPITYSLN